MNHQEIEFTFESGDPKDLFVLQTRDTVVSTQGDVPTFIPSPELEAARIAQGIGVSGGALSGRVACTMAGIVRVRERYPDDAVILLRPDTVPDDIALVLAADGVLTALGGASSHAAVAAKRLGKTCVVGCRALDVDDHAGQATLRGRRLTPGDALSISGRDGVVYLETHPVIMVGTTVDVDSGMATYGGSVRKRWWKPISFELVTPGDVPIRCDAMNGTCVLVPHEVAAQVGNIDPAFEHAMGDTDYALRTANAGLSVWIAPGVVGFCAQNSACGSFADQALPLRKRLKNMMDPKGLPLRSWLVFTRRHAGPAWPLFWIYPYAKVVLSSLFTKRI